MTLPNDEGGRFSERPAASSQGGSTQSILSQLISTLATQWNMIPRDRRDGVGDQARGVYDTIRTASGRSDSDLRHGASDHDALRNASDGLPRDVRQWMSRLLTILDDPGLQANTRFVQACSTGIGVFTKIFDHAGLTMPAAAASYTSAETTGASDYGATGRHSRREH